MSAAPPVFRSPERVLVHTFDGRSWTKVLGEVSLERTPFAKGGLREAYRSLLTRSSTPAPSSSAAAKPSPELVVCKFAMDSATPKTLYLHDVEAQVYAAGWADKFNEFLHAGTGAGDGGARVSFVAAFVVEFVDRPGRPLAGCEPYIVGDFSKHNNNVGATASADAAPSSAAPSESEDILVANAFSHFTYAKSGGQVLICDIQGVGGTYTDPQIHSATGVGFGAGNLGYTGIRAFLLRHKCSHICRQVRLPPIDLRSLASETAPSPAPAAGAAAGAAGAGAAGAPRRGGTGSRTKQAHSRAHAPTADAAAAAAVVAPTPAAETVASSQDAYHPHQQQQQQQQQLEVARQRLPQSMRRFAHSSAHTSRPHVPAGTGVESWDDFPATPPTAAAPVPSPAPVAAPAPGPAPAAAAGLRKPGSRSSAIPAPVPASAAAQAPLTSAASAGAGWDDWDAPLDASPLDARHAPQQPQQQQQQLQPRPGPMLMKPGRSARPHTTPAARPSNAGTVQKQIPASGFDDFDGDSELNDAINAAAAALNGASASPVASRPTPAPAPASAPAQAPAAAEPSAQELDDLVAMLRDSLHA